MSDEEDLRKALDIPDGVSLKDALSKKQDAKCAWCDAPIIKTRPWRRFCNSKCRKDFYNAAVRIRQAQG